MNVHAVVGHAAPRSADSIQVSLRDALSDGDSLSLVWAGPPNETLEAVYDYVLDEEVPFCMFYAEGNNPPRAFREAEFGVCQKTRNPDVAAVKSVEGDGTVLFLWDDNGGEGQVEYVFDNLPVGARVLELSNGLAPITVDVDIPEPRDPEVPKDDDEQDDIDFTKDELDIMSAAAVKRYGARKGCAGTTKGAIIEELFPAPPIKEVDAELEKLLDEAELRQATTDPLVSTDLVRRQELLMVVEEIENLVATLRKALAAS